jgi:uncharacterized iron-regulated protein
MKRVTTTILIFVLALNVSFAKKKKTKDDTYSSDLPAYVIYNSKGEKVSFSKMMEELYSHDICLFGEMHDDPIVHWLEKQVTQKLVEEKGSNLVLGGEMWEADQQLLMDEFMIHGLVDKKMYVESAKNWPNFRDYKPLLGIALRNNLKFVCTNIPRRYARVIYKKGIEYLDSLPQQAYQYLPPMPVHFDLTQPAYANMLSVFDQDDEAKNKHHAGAASAMMNYKGSNLVKAQAIKDATMAHRILQNWEEGQYFLHYNGTYHSKFYDSIYYYLKYYNPDVDIVTIHTWEAENVMELPESENAADFNIMIPASMPATYDQ